MDPRLPHPTKRLKPQLQFVQPGFHTQLADQIRQQEQFNLILENQQVHQGHDTAARIKQARGQLHHQVFKTLIPNIEWWDLPLLKCDQNQMLTPSLVKDNALIDNITHYIQHPVPIQPPAEPAPPPPQPLPLTKHERKKLRTRRREAAEKEKQDQIRAGLIPPPPPKVKLSSIMRVMKDDAVADPSAVEARVRSEVAQRVQNHEQRNLSNKLTPDERRAKRLRKLLNDPTGGGTPVSLYRINRVPSRQQRYKIDINAQQNHLTGTLLIHDLISLVIVEGGPKAQKRFRRLILNRMDWSTELGWNDGEEGDSEEDERYSTDVCKLIWEGTVAAPNFRTFRIEAAPTVEAARKVLKVSKCGHYWDMVLNEDSTTVGIYEESGEESSGEEGRPQ